MVDCSTMHAGVAIALSLLFALAQREPGFVDWERRTVRCIGIGAPDLRGEAGSALVARVGTERTARRAAQKNCMATLQDVAIETGRTVGTALSANGRLTVALEQIVSRSAADGVLRFFSDGGVELDMEVPLDGELSDLLLPAPRAPAPVVGGSAGATGVLVDAHALGLLPALAPRVLDDAGREIYGPGLLSRRARQGGTAAYARDVASALKSFGKRLGHAPKVVRAIGVQGCDVVVSKGDAQALRGSRSLEEGRVVIVAP